MPIDVSIVIPNFNGRALLQDCMESIAALDYPADRMETVLVDNGSSDDSIEYLRRNWPDVRVVALPHNLGFAGGINAGVGESRGKYVALLNNDAHVDPGWISNGLEGFRRGSDIGMVASKILNFDGTKIDFAGGGLAFYGHGFQIGYGELEEGQYDEPSETLFGCGCALFMPRNLFLGVGGLDDDYFAFFEDVDLGWRLWVMGYRIVYEPSSFVYHRHHGTADKLGNARHRFLLERNALMSMIKNYEQETLDKLLPASMMLVVQRGLSYSRFHGDKYDPGKPSGRALPGKEVLQPLTMANMLAISDLAANLPKVFKKKEFIESRRRRSDAEIAPLFKYPLTENLHDPAFLETYRTVVQASSVGKALHFPTNVLILTAQSISPRMAGPAIRAWEMASGLSGKHNVRLLAEVLSPDMEAPGFELDELIDDTLPVHLGWADVVVFQGYILKRFPQVADCGKILVADLYDPFHLENLEMFREDVPGKRWAIADADLDVLNSQLRSCDFFICASEKQRDFWIGQLVGAGRLSPDVYDHDPTLRKLIDVVPFGLSSEPPAHQADVIKGVVPGIEKDDKVLVWAGGIYNWLDPLVVIRAMAPLAVSHPHIKLFFMGMSHPDPDVPKMRTAEEAVDLAAELGLKEKNVFFNEGWVPYNERANYLLEADVGISCHLEHIETTYSHRTRVVDYFWAELPVIVTKGDALSQTVEDRGLGLSVTPGDVEGLHAAILRMVDDEEFARECSLNCQKMCPELHWSQVIGPLDRFCSAPKKAPRTLQSSAQPSVAGQPAGLPVNDGYFRHLIRMVGRTREEGGFKLIVSRTWSYAGRALLKIFRF